jgi:hypothetical protein
LRIIDRLKFPGFDSTGAEIGIDLIETSSFFSSLLG